MLSVQPGLWAEAAMNRTYSGALASILLLAVSCGRPVPTAAPAHPGGQMVGAAALPGACEAPASENEGKPGCYFDAAVEVGRLTGPAYWHVDEFADAASAELAKGPGGAVV